MYGVSIYLIKLTIPKKWNSQIERSNDYVLPIPDEILRPFDAVMEKKSIPPRLRSDYRKWLRYFLDYQAKYPPPDSISEQVRLFIKKLKSKGQSPQQLKEAAYAVSLLRDRAQEAGLSLSHAAEGTASVPKPATPRCPL